MDIGINISSTAPISRARRTAEWAESAGVSSLWMVDHLLGTQHPALIEESPIGELGAATDAFLDPFVALGSVASCTSLRLGVAVTDATRRRSADVARTTLTLNHIAPGGFNIGIGAGEAENLLPYGYAFDRPVARCAEFLPELRSMLDTGHLPDDPVARTGLPLRGKAGPPQVWVAGHGPRMLRLTGHYADGWIPAWAMSAEEYGERRDTINGHADDAGRPHPRSALQAFVMLGRSRDALAETADANPLSKCHAVLLSAETWRRYGLEHPAGPDARGLVDVIPHRLDPDQLRALAPKIPFEMMCEQMFVGSVQEVATRLREFEAAGCEEAVLANLSAIVGGREGAAEDEFKQLCVELIDS